jgi:beta-N-acetylhexosaminidase
MLMRIRPLQQHEDRTALERLWKGSLGDGWPVLPRGLDMLRQGMVAERNGRLIGVAARSGHCLQILMVQPSERRRGVGRALFDESARAARAEGHDRLTLGSGGENYIWPGVPVDAADAIAFFECLGYRWKYEAIDLVSQLSDWNAPKQAIAIAEAAPVALERVRHSTEAEQVVRFERQHFPDCTRHFEAGEGILAARHARAVVGALLYSTSGSPFEPALRSPCGSIGCVGVHPNHQGQGIATAMVLEATQVVRDSGAASCHIGWAWQTGLYERVGYIPWRRYLISTDNG